MVLPTLHPWQAITHWSLVSIHSGHILGLELHIGAASFAPARAVLVKTDMKNLHLPLPALPLFLHIPNKTSDIR